MIKVKFESTVFYKSIQFLILLSKSLTIFNLTNFASLKEGLKILNLVQVNLNQVME